MSHDWKNILVSPLTSIQEVLRTIDKEALQLALVVDASNRLLGTVTDGDIRRALINNVTLFQSVSEVMNATPTTVEVDTPRSKVLELMNTKQLHSIPVVDKDVVVLSLIHI